MCKVPTTPEKRKQNPKARGWRSGRAEHGTPTRGDPFDDKEDGILTHG